MATASVNERVQKYRDGMRRAGLRLVQIWVPDTRRQGFAAECRRQCRVASQADAADTELTQLLDEAVHDIEGWTS